MTPNQQKSFFTAGADGGGHYRRSGVAPSDQKLSVPGMVLLWALRKMALLIDRLIVLAKYQFFKHTALAPSRIKIPWTKLLFLSGLGFLSFKKDLSFTVGLPHAEYNSAAMAEQIILREKSDERSLFSIFSEKKKDYFADSPTDTRKDRKIKAYIRRFKDVAIVESKKYGIPASIKMAQAIVESDAGQSGLAKRNHNHFGIKCFSRTCRKGHCSNFGDDSHKDFFRIYGSAWESWRAHSKMIVSGRYKPLLKYGNDYRKWARGLKKLGYATAKHYEQTLVDIIETYHLQTLDENRD